MNTYTDEYRAKARERMRRRRAKGLHPCADCPTLVSATATRCTKHAALHREEQLEGKPTERGRHWHAKRARGIAPRGKTMSTKRPVTPPKHTNITNVLMQSDLALSPRLKWPGGLLAACLTLDNKNLQVRAALDLNVTVLIVQTDVEHFAAYGLEPPEFDYGALLEKFQLLKVEAFAARRNA